MASVTIEIPDDVSVRLRKRGSEPAWVLRMAAAFSLCSRGELSTSQAVRLAGVTYAEFLEAAARAKIELFPVNFEELKEEIGRGYTLGRQCVAGDIVGPSAATSRPILDH